MLEHTAIAGGGAFARYVATGVDASWVRNLYRFAVKPTIGFYFRISVEEALRRVVGAGTLSATTRPGGSARYRGRPVKLTMPYGASARTNASGCSGEISQGRSFAHSIHTKRSVRRLLRYVPHTGEWVGSF